MSPLGKKRIMIVEDCEETSYFLKRTLETLGGHDTFQAFDAKTFKDNLFKFKPHIIILDVLLPDQNGIDVYKEIHEKTPASVIFLTNKTDDETFQKIKAFKKPYYLVKPIKQSDLIDWINIALNEQNI